MMWAKSCSAIRSAGSSSPLRTPGSPWIPIPISISPSGRSKVGCPAAGSTQDERATPMERNPAAAALVVATTSASDAPSSARAPATLYSKAMPAIPRRRSSDPFGAEATSSAASTVATSIPSASASSAARSKFITSPE